MRNRFGGKVPDHLTSSKTYTTKKSMDNAHDAIDQLGSSRQRPEETNTSARTLLQNGTRYTSNQQDEE
jgi:hypothetical protein